MKSAADDRDACYCCGAVDDPNGPGPAINTGFCEECAAAGCRDIDVGSPCRLGAPKPDVAMFEGHVHDSVSGLYGATLGVMSHGGTVGIQMHGSGLTVCLTIDAARARRLATIFLAAAEDIEKAPAAAGAAPVVGGGTR